MTFPTLPSNVGVHTLTFYFKVMQGGEFAATAAMKVSGSGDRPLKLADVDLAKISAEFQRELEADFAGIEGPLVIGADGTGPSGPITVVPISCEEYNTHADEADEAELTAELAAAEAKVAAEEEDASVAGDTRNIQDDET